MNIKIIWRWFLAGAFVTLVSAQELKIERSTNPVKYEANGNVSLKSNNEASFDSAEEENIITIHVADEGKEVTVQKLSVMRPRPPLFDGMFAVFDLLGSSVSKQKITYIYQTGGKIYAATSSKNEKGFQSAVAFQIAAGSGFFRASITADKNGLGRIELEQAGGRHLHFHELKNGGFEKDDGKE